VQLVCAGLQQAASSAPEMRTSRGVSAISSNVPSRSRNSAQSARQEEVAFPACQGPATTARRRPRRPAWRPGAVATRRRKPAPPQVLAKCRYVMHAHIQESHTRAATTRL
jgi:hypothetical protein